jgi:hypothetical protein
MMTSGMMFPRSPDPARVFGRAGLLFCGVALTWTCAAFGLFLGDMGTCTLSVPAFREGRVRVADVHQALTTYQIERNRCPTTSDDLIAGGYIDPRRLVDPWRTRIAFSCSRDDTNVISAGPDRVFGTTDDIKDPPR